MMDNTDPALYRIVEVLRNGKWIKTRMKDIKEGEYFRYKEPSIIAFWQYFEAKQDGFEHHDGYDYVMSDPMPFRFVDSTSCLIGC